MNQKNREFEKIENAFIDFAFCIDLGLRFWNRAISKSDYPTKTPSELGKKHKSSSSNSHLVQLSKRPVS